MTRRLQAGGRDFPRPPDEAASAASSRCLRAEETKDGEDAAMVLGRRRQPELREDGGHVLLHRTRRDEEPLADRLVRTALRHELEHLALARRKPLDRVVSAIASDELGHDEGIERRPAV